ncbi:MAG: UDP-N-acetylglucosamine--N-acetylmuramyl-(pentapeptide) pyrophosphoryl-undecaprenol N-acetylglucosamine transferase [Verrucomicrobiales bacterium]|jgi:UDP-N-acetylglucosamine--N-acetylmuramyl-(pentapeptide) pyrophosphoryl-undecaprenol N-acetylglucosamine transferase
MPLKIVIACGGTGGHLFPGIAVAQALRARGHESVLLISEKEIDALASQGYSELEFRKVPAIGLPKLVSPAAVKFGFKLISTYRRCAKIIKSFEADAVLGMGGFTSMPPIMAGRRRKAKTFIHESNAIPGKANKLTARWVDTVLLGLDECAQHFPGRETRTVGTPLREAMTNPVDRAEALEFFGFEGDTKKTLFIMGGSQGARGVNRGVADALSEFDPDGVRIIHITGKSEFESVTAALGKSGIEHYVSPFCQRMELAYELADLAIARSGASSLTELAAFGVPSILIPYPYAAEDHQTRNAEVFSKRKAAILMREDELSRRCLGKVVNDLFMDAQTLGKIGNSMAALAVLDAAENICDMIEESCR